MTNSTTANDSPSAVLNPVLVLGGTGKTGRRVAEGLRRGGFTPRVASRSGTVRFDWSDRSSWDSALAGVRAVYVVDSMSPAAPDELRAFGAAAAAQGVERLVLLSARTWSQLDDGSGAKLAAERAVQESGLEWTILRPVWFAQNFTEDESFAPLFATGELRLPTGDGRERFVDLEDLADVAVAALTEPGHHGRIYELTGPRALSLAEAVAELSAASGRPLRYVAVTDEEYREQAAARGHEKGYVDLLLTLFRHLRANGGIEAADGVREALGREPRDFAEYLGRAEFPPPGPTDTDGS
ncbi:NAD(P)H-binding protein [Streptomyces sp. CAU 1734]|uniref:NAD(P)H-binding protein n=1 Tax=Streptomyces sp. CAU 1734 TaxID=3140360 RepID=UPI0032618285